MTLQPSRIRLQEQGGLEKPYLLSGCAAGGVNTIGGDSRRRRSACSAALAYTHTGSQWMLVPELSSVRVSCFDVLELIVEGLFN